MLHQLMSTKNPDTFMVNHLLINANKFFAIYTSIFIPVYFQMFDRKLKL